MVNTPLSPEYENARRYDVQIATLLGFEDIKYIPAYGDYYGTKDNKGRLLRIPRYEDSIGAAWEIIDHVQSETDLYFDISSAGGGGLQYRCDLKADEDSGDLHVWSIEDTPGRAIVSAFLKLQEVKEA